MPAIIYRINKLFPDLRSEDADDNILLKTIRVPKKLLSLTNRLPKPNYVITEEEKHNRHTTIGSYLPDIGNKKGSQYKAYLGNKKQFKKLFGGDRNIDISKLDTNSRKLKLLDRNPSKETQEELSMEDDNRLKERSLGNDVKSVNKLDCDENQVPRESPHNHSPTKKLIHELSVVKRDNGLNKENPKQDILRLIRNKYLRHKPKGKQSIESNQISSINKSDLYDYNSAAAANSYIRQLVNRRSPIVKPHSYNMQMLANIYSDNPQQLSLIARKLQSIKRTKMPKQKDHNLTPLLQREVKGVLRSRHLTEDHAKATKSKDDIISKHRLEPIKLVNNNNMELQSIGINQQDRKSVV